MYDDTAHTSARSTFHLQITWVNIINGPANPMRIRAGNVQRKYSNNNNSNRKTIHNWKSTWRVHNFGSLIQLATQLVYSYEYEYQLQSAGIGTLWGSPKCMPSALQNCSRLSILHDVVVIKPSSISDAFSILAINLPPAWPQGSNTAVLTFVSPSRPNWEKRSQKICSSTLHFKTTRSINKYHPANNPPKKIK